jgi:hypothetical protein
MATHKTESLFLLLQQKEAGNSQDFPKPTHGGEDLPAYVNVKDVRMDLASVKPDIGNGQVQLVNWSFTDDHSLDGIPSLCKPGPDREIILKNVVSQYERWLLFNLFHTGTNSVEIPKKSGVISAMLCQSVWQRQLRRVSKLPTSS